VFLFPTLIQVLARPERYWRIDALRYVLKAELAGVSKAQLITPHLAQADWLQCCA